MQEQIQESLLETRQVRQSQQDLSDRVAAFEPKIDNIHVSHATNPLLVPQFHENRCHYTRPLFRMEVPHFNETEPLSWIFKIYNSLTSTMSSKKNESPSHPSI